MDKQTWNDRSNEWLVHDIRSLLSNIQCVFSKKGDTLFCVYFLRKMIFSFVTIIQLSSVDFFLKKSFSLLSPTFFTFRFLLWAHGFFLFIVFFMMLSIPKFTNGSPSRWLLYPVDMSPSVFEYLLAFFDTKRCSRPTLYFFCPRNCFFWN